MKSNAKSYEIVFTNPYWSIKWKVEYLQRYILIHSIIYYELNGNIITDCKWDAVAKQLVRLQRENKKDVKDTMYWYVFNAFDGSTGFDLYDRLNAKDKSYLLNIASHVLKGSE